MRKSSYISICSVLQAYIRVGLLCTISLYYCAFYTIVNRYSICKRDTLIKDIPFYYDSGPHGQSNGKLERVKQGYKHLINSLFI